MISAVVLTKNEEANIERCLTSLSWCDEIIVVDDYSEDETSSVVSCQLSVVRKKIKVFKRHLNGDFSGQRNFGLAKVSYDWVLFIDADEIVTEELKKEILSICYPELCHIVGYYLKRKDYFLGRWLKYGETGNIRLFRLAKKNAGCWKGKVHEKWEIKGKIGILANPLLHYPHQSIPQFLEEINWYTNLVAQCWKEEGRKIAFWEIIVYPLGKFVQNYILRLGFLDGIPGLILAMLMSFHSFLVRSKLLSLRAKRSNLYN